MTDYEAPRVWVGCLACYNAGDLVGRWLDADDDRVGDLAYIHGDSPITDCEELWVMDTAGFGPWLTGECSPWEAAKVAAVMAEVAAGGVDVSLVAEWADSSGALGDLIEAGWAGGFADRFADEYQGEWESRADYAAYFTRECGQCIPPSIEPYVDYDAMGRDLELGGDIFRIGRHVFAIR